MRKKSFIIDSLLNIISSALPLLVLQTISLPIIAKELGVFNYGTIITLISGFTIFSFPFGNVLNNIRLLMNKTYIENSLKGDFNLILIVISVISIPLITIFTIFIYPSISIFEISLLIFITVLGLWKEYLIVSFRLKLNYKGILLNNIYMGLGFIVGTLVFSFVGYWQLIYIFGLIFSLIYITNNSSLHREPYRRTSLMGETKKKFIQLYISSLLKNLVVHADKLILLPLVGPVGVGVYYTSTIIGKIISMMINPINSVMLSYLVKTEKIDLKNFFKMFGIATLVGIIGYFVTVFISPYFLNHFYSELANEALNLIYITTAIAVVDVLSTVINPFNLRFNKTIWQIYMSLVHLILYVGFSYYFFETHGLIGFSFGILIAAILKLCLQLSVFLINHHRNYKLV